MSSLLEWMAFIAVLLAALAVIIMGGISATRGLTGLLASRLLRELHAQAVAHPAQGYIWGIGAGFMFQAPLALIIPTLGLVHHGQFPMNSALAVMLGVTLGAALAGQILAYNLSWAIVPLFSLAGWFWLNRNQPMCLSLAKLLSGFASTLSGFFLLARLFAHAPTDFVVLVTRINPTPWLAGIIGLVGCLLYGPTPVFSLAITLEASRLLSLTSALAASIGIQVANAVLAVVASVPLKKTAQQLALVYLILMSITAIVFVESLQWMFSTGITGSNGMIVSGGTLGFDAAPVSNPPPKKLPANSTFTLLAGTTAYHLFIALCLRPWTWLRGTRTQ